MITFTHITAIDTFSYRKLEFDFRTGLTAIEGTNGASKTSIFMALQIGLFNRCFKDCKIDSVNNNVTEKPFEITVSFTKDGLDYVVVNSRKTGKITVTMAGEDISLKRVPENLKLIEEILGIDYKTFLDLTYQAKESSLNLLETSTDKGRKEFLARVLRLDEIDAEQARCKEKEKDLGGKNGRITLLTSQIQTLESSLGDILAEDGEYAISHLEKELQEKNAELLELTKEVIRLENEVKEVDTEVAGWVAEQGLRVQLADLKKDVDETAVGDRSILQANARETSENLSKNEQAVTALKALIVQLEKYSGIANQVAGAKETLDLLPVPDMPLPECTSQKEKISNAWKVRQSKIDSALAELIKFEAAHAKGECPTCGGHADVSEQIKTIQEDVQKDTIYVDKCTTSYQKYSGWITAWGDIQKATTKLEKLQVELSSKPEGELEVAKANLLLLQQEYDTLSQLDIDARQVQKSAEAQETLKVDILECSAKITRGVDCLYSDEYVVTVKLNRNKATTQLASVKSEIDCIQQDLEEKKDHNAKVRATIALNRQILENNQKITLQVDQFRKELEACENKLELLKTWQGILGSKGYRVARIKKFISSLNGLMVKYSQMISGGRIKCSFFITETGEIDFTITDEAKTMSYELWSGGEKSRVKLVCLFAVLELLESMGSLSFNVLALDEIFSALDTEGKEGLFNVLSYLKGHSKAVFTIAHEELVLDLQYDYKVKAEKLQDGTTEVHYV